VTRAPSTATIGVVRERQPDREQDGEEREGQQEDDGRQDVIPGHDPGEAPGDAPQHKYERQQPEQQAGPGGQIGEREPEGGDATEARDQGDGERGADQQERLDETTGCGAGAR
jgi:hypothetical protein